MKTKLKSKKIGVAKVQSARRAVPTARATASRSRTPRVVNGNTQIKRGLLGSIGSLAGGALGNLVGGPGLGALGSSILGSVGDWVGNITGMGAYKLKQNSLMGDSGPPTFNDAGNLVFSHREFLSDVVGSTAFNLTAYNLNPGLGQSFPLLSIIAACFEQYKFLGLVFEFKKTSATAVSSTNTALGVVVTSTNYDVFNPNFQNKQQMEAYEYTTSCCPTDNMVHGVECAPANTPVTTLYVRTSSGIPVGADQRFYDLGVFQLATVGMQAAATIGELWVSYHIELIKPKLPTPIGSIIPTGHYELLLGVLNGTSTAFGSIGSTIVARPGSTLGNCLVDPSDNTLWDVPLNNVGRYLVLFYGNGSANWSGSTSAFAFTLFLGANLVAVNQMINNAASQITGGVINATINMAMRFIVVDVLAAGTSSANYLQMRCSSSMTTASGTSNIGVYVTQVSSGLTLPNRLTQPIVEDSLLEIQSRLNELLPAEKRIAPRFDPSPNLRVADDFVQLS